MMASLQGNLLSIDPSFRSTGLCYYFRDTDQFSFGRIGWESTFRKHFIDMYEIADIVSSDVLTFFKKTSSSEVVLESPPPRSAFSAGMYMLCTKMVEKLYPWASKIYISPPAMGRVLFITRKWTKTDSVNIVKTVLNVRVASDEADAFIQAIPLLPKTYSNLAGIKREVEYERLK